MADEYNKISRKQNPGVVTGKPVFMGGSKGRDNATAEGAFYITEEIVKKQKLNPKKSKVAIQGFGNAGYNLAKFLHKAGFKIVALSDSKGAIYSEKGFDPEEIMKVKKKTGSLCYTKKCKGLTNEELLELKVDILIPAALENQITKDNAKNIKAKIIIEIANGPTTIEADLILNKNKVLVVPDIICNAGGVTVSYFEWVQNREGYYWSKKEVSSKLKKIMVEELSNIFKAKNEFKVELRAAAYAHALKRIAQTIESKGTKEFFKRKNG